jgi:hypothetical protein
VIADKCLHAVHVGVSTASIHETRKQIFDRTRLLIDLDEATDPSSPPSVFVLVGLRCVGDVDDLLVELRHRFAAAVGPLGATYTTRGTELCAIIKRSDGPGAVLDTIRRDLEAAAGTYVRVASGMAELPREACDATAALALADQRLTAAHGPIRFD